MNDVKAEALRQAVAASSENTVPEAIVLTAREFEKYLNDGFTQASDSSSEKTTPRAVGFLADLDT